MTEAERRRMESTGKKAEVVFVMSEGKAEMRKVKTGIADFEQVEILDGLKEGETIISGPFSAITKSLQSGDEVKLKEKKQSIKKLLKLKKKIMKAENILFLFVRFFKVMNITILFIKIIKMFV